MNVVGRVGSLISQGVYSVATPFHPFGGAVDIIVVEQEDGTYRSTPWYVRFGKFQGVIKGLEKVVSISVNGVQASFHMYLDHSGQAYFMREVGSSDTHSSGHASAVSSPHKSCQGDAVADSAETNESTYEEHEEEEENDDGLKDDHSSTEHSSAVSTAFSPYSYGNLEEVEEMVKSSNDSNSEMLLISVDGHVLTAPVCADEEASSNYVQSTNPQFHLGPGEGTNEDYCAVFTDLDASTYRESNTSGQTMESPKDEKRDSVDDEDTHKTIQGDTGMGESTCAGGEICKTSDGDMGLRTRNDDMFKSCLDLTSQLPDMDVQDIDSTAEGSLDKHSPKSSSSEIIVEKDAVKDDSNCENTEALEHVYIQAKVSEDNNLPCTVNLLGTDKVIDSSEKLLINENRDHLASVDFVSNETEKMASKSGRSDVERGCDHQGTHRMTISELGFELSLCGNLLRPGMGRSSAEEAFEAHRISEKEFKASGPSIIKNGNLIVRYEKSYLHWAKAAYIVLGKAAFGPNFSFETPDSIPIEVGTPNAKEDAYEISPSSRGWRLWPIPFRRAASLQHSNSNSSSEEFFVDSETALQSPFAEQSANVNNMSPRTQSPRKQLLRTYIPTTEQIASLLNLKDGQNIIAFSFSTRVLGKQEVDAHIYLWKWNARIVISDVDGTITKSDVLGQVMPLVGKDWTQSGVAGLFSAIKENGYQLLFLSARAIVQAYLTRSFLLNLKQDGKALPSGPIVISPDGLFPSLFREVIRRAPHEFKIACLEDIRALFPSDYNPFYAGFGNRDTDELSYRKIGIPKGKIFIINPKGEVAINHCVDVKSYTSLHTLVNDMFPSTSLVEQEDFNNWNYWKVPLPIID